MEEPIDFRRWTGPVGNDQVMEWKAGGGRVAGFFWRARAGGAAVGGWHPAGQDAGRAARTPPPRTNTSAPSTAASSAICCNRALTGFARSLIGCSTNSRDHLRRLSDICTAKRLAPFCHHIDVPHVSSDSSLARLTAQLRVLKERLESSFAVAITSEKLAAAVELYNRTRVLLSRASRLRSEDAPRTTGSEVLAMAVAAASMPKDRFNGLLTRRLDQIEAANGAAPRGPRLMIIGGLDDPAYLEVIESMGATIVADQLCWGLSRSPP